LKRPAPHRKRQRIVGRLNTSLDIYFAGHQVGVTLPDVEFALGPDWRLRADIAIVRTDRWEQIDQNRVPVQGVPNIAVEVISPSERTAESARKVWSYLRSGVEEVWQVFPETKEVAVYTAHEPVRIFTSEERLATPLLPGWSLSIHEIVGS
jgi:Uma2 family endonuclease